MKIRPLWLVVIAVIIYLVWSNRQQVASLTVQTRRTL